MGCGFVITAFSSFSGVDANPTEAVLHELLPRLEEDNLSDSIVDSQLLPVAAEDVNTWLEEKSDSLQQHCNNNEHLMWLHFGVDQNCEIFKLEARAANEAAFQCPDQRGWQPESEKICSTDDAPHMETDLPLQALQGKLSQKYDVQVSKDAGRFLCNYIYYRSLSKCQARWHSLFVHVPLFDAQSKETQLDFYVDVIRALKENFA